MGREVRWNERVKGIPVNRGGTDEEIGGVKGFL